MRYLLLLFILEHALPLQSDEQKDDYSYSQNDLGRQQANKYRGMAADYHQFDRNAAPEEIRAKVKSDAVEDYSARVVDGSADDGCEGL